VSEADRERWDARYGGAGLVMGAAPKAAVTALLAPHLAPARGGLALDVAAGEGQTGVFLAQAGLARVDLVDVSAVGLAKAQALADAAGVGARVRLHPHDLDAGLPGGLAPAYDVVTCLHFRPSPALAAQIAARVAPGGLLLRTALAAAHFAGKGDGPSPRFLAAPGELAADLGDAFEILALVEGAPDGPPDSQLLARRRA